jgi:hypothetical protein
MKGEGFKCPLGASHLCSLSFHASGSDTLQFQRNWVVFIMPSSSSFTLLQGNSGDVRQEIQGWMDEWMDHGVVYLQLVNMRKLFSERLFYCKLLYDD